MHLNDISAAKNVRDHKYAKRVKYSMHNYDHPLTIGLYCDV